MANFEEFATSADFGRAASYEERYDEEDIKCPKMIFAGKRIKRLTMTREQCIMRYRTGNPCTEKCRVIKDILKNWGKK
jgi:hypothetical protein